MWEYNGPSGSRLDLNPENTGDSHHRKYGSFKNEMGSGARDRSE